MESNPSFLYERAFVLGYYEAYDKSIAELIQSAEKGYPIAQYMLAYLHLKRIQQVECETRGEIFSATESSLAHCSFMSHYMHYTQEDLFQKRIGHGNAKEAVSLLSQANQAGFFPAAYPLGYLHSRGIGVSKSEKKANQFHDAYQNHQGKQGWIKKPCYDALAEPVNLEALFKWDAPDRTNINLGHTLDSEEEQPQAAPPFCLQEETIKLLP
jgi:TPR repeat protein